MRTQAITYEEFADLVYGPRLAVGSSPQEAQDVWALLGRRVSAIKSTKKNSQMFSMVNPNLSVLLTRSLQEPPVLSGFVGYGLRVSVFVELPHLRVASKGISDTFTCPGALQPMVFSRRGR